MITLREDNIACCGCGNCAQVCPCQAVSIECAKKKGFLIPKIDAEKCVRCGKCLKVCPIIKSPARRNRMHKVIAFKLHNKENRLNCQSGGAFCAIAQIFFSKYKNVAVYGVALCEASMQIRYIRIDRPKQLGLLASSKYAQANMSGIQKQVQEDLRNGLYVLFSGTPCHIGALVKYLKMQKIDTDRLLLLDFLCHGVLSQKLFQEYIDKIEKLLGEQVHHFRFRDKRIDGWGGIILPSKHRNAEENICHLIILICTNLICTNLICVIGANTPHRKELRISQSEIIGV